jgi:hypothetical protein
LAGSSRACKQCKDTLHKIYAPLTSHIASLKISGKLVTSHIASAIKEASYCKELTSYIPNQSEWQNTDTFYSIDWEARSRAGKLVPPGQRLTLFKLEFALFATMSRLHRMEQAIDHRCQKFQETLAHVFQCPSAVELCRKALMKAQATIWKKPLHKFVVTALVSGISQWSTGAQVQSSGSIPGPADDIGTLAFKAFQEQQDIGWDQTIRGRLSKTWGEANMLYCTTCLNQGDTIQAAWSAHLVKSLWQYGIEQLIARNKYIYGKTKEEQVEKKTKEINKQIKVMHRADKFRVRGTNRHLFNLSLKKMAGTIIGQETKMG